VYENLSYRANVIAFLKAMVLYVAQGEKWDKTLENFIRWSLQYDMWCKMQFFGKEIELADYEVCSRTGTGPQNMLDLLPDTFTREDAQRMRQQMGIERGSLKQMLANWRHRGYIAPVVRGEEAPDSACQLFAKTEDYLRRK
ncbi:MAG: hypothetical protein IKZ17_02630, partial [Bacteroidaceae bacterium]|nr:hypothetical protein [Bacteroidaceae bacterium]